MISIRFGLPLLVAVCLLGATAAHAQSPYVKFLQSGRVPAERMPSILGLIAKNGSADDLAYVLAQAARDDGFPAEVRPVAFEALLEAATTRDLKPSGDLTVLGPLVTEKNTPPAVRQAALKLAGAWKVEGLAGELEKLLSDKQTPTAVRQQALASLAQIGGAGASATFEKLAAKENPVDARILAVAALAQSNADRAAQLGAQVLADLSDRNDPAPLLDALLAQQKGPDALAEAIRGHKVPADAAKLALRHLYSIGRTDEALVAALSDAAGISAEVKPLTPEELQRMVAEVNAHGDARRGELIFRRAELSCVKCHSVSGAGGNIGPDLSALGQSSPVDYVITSILTPELSVKEEFQLAKVFTSEGKVYVGIIAEDNADRLVLKDAEGKRITIPKDGEEEIVHGGSLMPKGLANFLTHAELLDLVKFVSELGKPGEFAVRTQPTMQRWRVLVPTPDKPSREVPNEQTFHAEILESPNWQPAYAKVAGDLPLEELVRLAGSTTLYLQGEINVTSAGKVVVDLAGAPGGVTAWLGDKPLVLVEGEATAEVDNGTHKLTLRVDTAQRDAKVLKLLVRPAGEGAAEYTIVGGP